MTIKNNVKKNTDRGMKRVTHKSPQKTHTRKCRKHTKQHTRVTEHAGRSFRTCSILSVPPHSMVRTHPESCGVPVTFRQFLHNRFHI